MLIGNVGKIQLFWHGYKDMTFSWRLSAFVKYFPPICKIQKRNGDYIKRILWILGLSICW